MRAFSFSLALLLSVVVMRLDRQCWGCRGTGEIVILEGIVPSKCVICNGKGRTPRLLDRLHRGE